jgi:hypothetical protein
MKTRNLSALTLLSLFGACTTTTTEAMVGGPSEFPGMPEANYRLVGRVNGEGTASTLSPGFLWMFGSPSSEELARETAVGNAIFDRDDVDIVLAAKSRVTTTRFLGFFSHSKVQIKGEGAKLEQRR